MQIFVLRFKFSAKKHIVNLPKLNSYQYLTLIFIICSCQRTLPTVETFNFCVKQNHWRVSIGILPHQKNVCQQFFQKNFNFFKKFFQFFSNKKTSRRVFAKITLFCRKSTIFFKKFFQETDKK